MPWPTRRPTKPTVSGALVETSPFAVAEGATIPDYSSSGLTQEVDVSGLPADSNIEAVTLAIDVTHPFTNDLGIHLISPSGTQSVLNPVFNDILANDQDLDWQLLSNAFYGERPNGTLDAQGGRCGAGRRWAPQWMELALCAGHPSGLSLTERGHLALELDRANSGESHRGQDALAPGGVPHAKKKPN